MTPNRRSDSELKAIAGKAERLASLMDDAIVIPGTKIRLGWDSILGIVPGVGDVAGLLSHLFLVVQAKNVGVRKRIYAKMLLNALIDLLVGAVPIVGDVADIFWKANRKNANLLKEEIARQRGT